MGAPSLRFVQEPALSLSKGRARCRRYHKVFVMPSGLHRIYGAHHLHFITCSCYRRLPFLDSPRSRDCFLSILEQARERHRYIVVGYVVMPEHIHLLITEPEVGTPSTVMQVLKQRRLALCYRNGTGEIVSSLISLARSRNPEHSGRRAFTISTFGPSTSVSRSYGTCIAIPSNANWWIRPNNGIGAVTVSICSMKLVR